MIRDVILPWALGGATVEGADHGWYAVEIDEKLAATLRDRFADAARRSAGRQ